jgi:hypothetical protein
MPAPEPRKNHHKPTRSAQGAPRGNPTAVRLRSLDVREPQPHPPVVLTERPPGSAPLDRSSNLDQRTLA